jgi:hypothetical protein
MACSKDFTDLDKLSTFIQEELLLETSVYDYYLETDNIYPSRKEAQYVRREIIDAIPGVYVYITENYDDYAVRIELED